MKANLSVAVALALTLGACANNKQQRPVGPPTGYHTFACTHEEVRTVSIPDYYGMNRYPSFGEVYNTAGYYSERRCRAEYNLQVPHWEPEPKQK